MSALTRRGFLQASAPAVITGIAASAAPVVAASAMLEEPKAKAHRLVRELSEALNEVWEGRFGAEVFPSRIVDQRWPKGFFDIKSQSEAWQRGRDAQEYLRGIEEMPVQDRIRHHMQQLRLALVESDPGRWDATFDAAHQFVIIVRRQDEMAGRAS